MIRDAVTILREILRRLMNGIRKPEADPSLPAPDELRKEAVRYE